MWCAKPVHVFLRVKKQHLSYTEESRTKPNLLLTVFLQVHFMERFWKGFLYEPVGNSFQKLSEPVGHLPPQSLHLVAHGFQFSRCSLHQVRQTLQESFTSSGDAGAWKKGVFTEKCSLLTPALLHSPVATHCCAFNFAPCRPSAGLWRHLSLPSESALCSDSFSIVFVVYFMRQSKWANLVKIKTGYFRWHAVAVLIFKYI